MLYGRTSSYAVDSCDDCYLRVSRQLTSTVGLPKEHAFGTASLAGETLIFMPELKVLRDYVRLPWPYIGRRLLVQSVLSHCVQFACQY